MTTPDAAAGAASPRRPRSVLVGLIGEGVGPSLTPPMHELEGARRGMHYVYRTIDLAQGEGDADTVQALLASARRMGFTGLNITHPIKQAVIPFLDELTPGAEAVGAVNTVVFTEAGMVGHNTDVTGFGSALRGAFGDDGFGRVVLFGAGGAGSAVATALSGQRVAELALVDGDTDRAEALADQVRATGTAVQVRTAHPSDAAGLVPDADLVINATPVGMAAHPGTPFDIALLHPGIRVADIVYRPAFTRLLQGADRIGCATMTGLGMAMHQAADAFEIFTGERADRDAMLADLYDLVAAEATDEAAALAP